MTITAAGPRDTPAHMLLDWSRETVEPALRAAVDTLPEDIRHIAQYHFGWVDENGQPARAGWGKALRPALALLTAKAVGASPERAVPAAVAVELVHDFSLVHDDIMDGDATRRHRPTAWNVFGVSSAILVGDALVTLSSDVLAGSEDPAALSGIRRLNTAVQDLIRGQLMDIAFEQRSDVSVAECQRMAGAKTGALLSVACELGAMFGGGGPEQTKHLRAFGECLGLAFQHTDDLLGIWGDPETTGKSAYSDLRSRKKTLPIVSAMNSDTMYGRDLIARYQLEAPRDEAELSETARLVDAAGGRAWSTQQADQWLTEALGNLDGVTTADGASALTAIAHLATHRDS